MDAICREQMLWTPTIVGKYDVLHLSRLNAVDAFYDELMLLAPSLLIKWCGLVKKKNGKQKPMTGIVGSLTSDCRERKERNNCISHV